MSPLPVLTTNRLTLRPAKIPDAKLLTDLLQDKDISATTATIPYPYSLQDAQNWIKSQLKAKDKQANFVMTLIESKELIGVVGLKLDLENSNAELGYWVGKPYWNRGFATEAGKAVLDYGFGTLKLHRIHAHCMARNPSSGRVLEKLGMQHEGFLREHFKKLDQFQSLQIYGVLAREYNKGTGT